MKPVRDSVFENEITPFRGEYKHHISPPYGSQPDSILQKGWKDYYPKRKDSLKMILMIRRKMDSLDNKYNK